MCRYDIPMANDGRWDIWTLGGEILKRDSKMSFLNIAYILACILKMYPLVVPQGWCLEGPHASYLRTLAPTAIAGRILPMSSNMQYTDLLGCNAQQGLRSKLIFSRLMSRKLRGNYAEASLFYSRKHVIHLGLPQTDQGKLPLELKCQDHDASCLKSQTVSIFPKLPVEISAGAGPESGRRCAS